MTSYSHSILPKRTIAVKANSNEKQTEKRGRGVKQVYILYLNDTTKGTAEARMHKIITLTETTNKNWHICLPAEGKWAITQKSL